MQDVNHITCKQLCIIIGSYLAPIQVIHCCRTEISSGETGILQVRVEQVFAIQNTLLDRWNNVIRLSTDMQMTIISETI